MQVIQSGYRGMSLLIQLNADRLLMLAALGGALMLGAYIGAN